MHLYLKFPLEALILILFNLVPRAFSEFREGKRPCHRLALKTTNCGFSINLSKITFAKYFSKTADARECLQKIHVLQRIDKALNVGSFASFCLKPLKVKCFEHVLNGFDVVAVLPTGFGEIFAVSTSVKFLAVQQTIISLS